MLKFWNKSLNPSDQRTRHHEFSKSLNQSECELSASQASLAAARREHEELLDRVAAGEADAAKLQITAETVAKTDAEVNRLTAEVAQARQVASRAGQLAEAAAQAEHQIEVEVARSEYIAALRELTDALALVYTVNLKTKGLFEHIRDTHPNIVRLLPRWRYIAELGAFGRLTPYFLENGEEALSDASRVVRAAMLEDRNVWDREQSARNGRHIPWRNPIEVAEEREARMRWEMLPEKQRARVKLEDVLKELHEDRERRRKAYREERAARFDQQLQEQRRLA